MASSSASTPAASFDITPFQTFDEYATMRHVLANYPGDMDRAGKDVYSILVRIDDIFSTYNEAEVALAVENASYSLPMPSFSSRDGAQSSAPLHPQLYPATTVCAKCSLPLTGPFQRELGDGILLHTYENGPIPCSLYRRTCTQGRCGAQHHYSHSSFPDGTCFLADGALDQEYLLLCGTSGGSGAHGVQIKLLNTQCSNVTNGHLTFVACAQTYNDMYCANSEDAKLDVHVLNDHYFALNALRYLNVMQCLEGRDLRRIFTRQARRDGMDDFLLDMLPCLRVCFSRYWSLHPFRPLTDNMPLIRASFPPVNQGQEHGHSKMAPEDSEAFAFSLMPQLSDASIMHAEENPFEHGCGDEICSQTMTVDGHMKVNRPTCQREDARIRPSEEIKGLRMMCPNRPMFVHGRMMAYCKDCALAYTATHIDDTDPDAWGEHESAPLRGVGAPAQAEDHLSRERTATATGPPAAEATVMTELDALAAAKNTELHGKKFTIPPDDGDDEGKANESVYCIEAVEVHIVEDEDSPAGRASVVAIFFDLSKPKPRSNKRMEWSALSEVSEWVTAYDEMPPAVVPASSRPPKGKSAAKASSSLSSTSSKRQSTRLALVAQKSADAEAARCSGSTTTHIEQEGGAVDDDEGEGAAAGGGGQLPAAKRAKQNKNDDDGHRYVFNRIVSRSRNPGGATRFICEYKKKDGGVVRLVHTKSQLTDVAIRAYEERLQEQTFRYTHDEAAERMLMCGNNDKEQQKVEKKRGNSAGIGAGITNCGIEIDIYELFGKESCSQVWLNWLDLMERCPELWRRLRCLCYDDACHLKAFAKKRAHLSDRAKYFTLMQLVCDEMHFKNHSNQPTEEGDQQWRDFCRTQCDPKLHESSSESNTEVCEQEFSWTARYKYSASYMTPGRFLLHMITIQDHRNYGKIARRNFARNVKRSSKSKAGAEKKEPGCTLRCCPSRQAAAAALCTPCGAGAEDK